VNDRGALFVVSGPSGVGKSTLLRAAMELVDRLAFSVSATTRARRVGEVDGVDYHFIDDTEFSRLVADDAFLEHATVYDRSYGTLRAPVEASLDRGESILLDIDVRGAAQVRERMPEGVHIFVLPPSDAALEARLRARGTDPEPVIARRMELAREQLRDCGRYQYLVVNDDLERATHELEAILIAELCRTERRASLVERYARA
jgi:guanylate kinase